VHLCYSLENARNAKTARTTTAEKLMQMNA